MHDSLYGRPRSKRSSCWLGFLIIVPVSTVRDFESSLRAKNRLYEAGPEVPKGCPGCLRREEAKLPATKVVLQVLDQILEHVTCFKYVLFDSWFSVGPIILGVKQRQRDVICMLKDAINVFYGYNGKIYRLRDLYAVVAKRKAKNGVIASVVVYYYGIQVRIVFVRNEKAKREWLALLSTDINIPEEEIIRIYGLRWDIEVYFKMCKIFSSWLRRFRVVVTIQCLPTLPLFA